MKGDYQMSYKIIKATLPVVALGALSQVAQADTLDDAIKDAKDAGFSTSVQTRTEKVSSQSEADRLNQEEANRVQALAQRIQAQIQEAKTSDQSVRQIVTSVLTDQAKTNTESTGQNQTIVRENTDAQKAYEEAVKAVEAKNAKAQADYEAQKAKIAEENAKAQQAYEAKKAKVEADNANNKKAYEEAIKRIAAENKQAQDAYQANRQKTEAELHTKEWSDTKVVEDAKAAGVTVRPAKTVDKGTVKESDLAGLQSEYDKAVADIRAKLEVAKKEVAKANVEFKASNELKQFVKTQQDVIKALIDKDNANSGTTHIRTVIKQGPVIENTDELKKAYQDLLQTAKDNAVRDWNAQRSYYLSQGKSADESETLANKAIASHFLTWDHPIHATAVGPTNYETLLRSLGAKVTEVPVTQTFPTLPLGADATSNDPKVVEYKQAWKAFNDKVLDVYKSNDVVVKFLSALQEGAGQGMTQGFMLSDNYEADLERYQKAQREIEDLSGHYEGAPLSQLIYAYNDDVKSEAPLLMTEIYSRATHGSSLRQQFANQSNIKITKSSDAVQFLNPPAKMDGSMFDIRTPKTSATTPQFFSFSNQGLADGGVDVTLVRIPKGQSITVRYTLKSGQPYLSGKQMISGQPLAVQLFAKETADAYRTSNKKLTDADIQDVYTIESTITNNGGVNDGDMVVGVANRTGAPFMIGVSNGTSPDDRIMWNLNPNDPRLAFSYQTETVLRNKQNQVLTPGLIQGAMTKTPYTLSKDAGGHIVGNTFQLTSDAYYTTDYSAALLDSREITLVDRRRSTVNQDGMTWGSYSALVNEDGEEIYTPEDGWRDQHMWSLMHQGMVKDNTALTTTRKTYNKVLLDWGAKAGTNNWAEIHETGNFYVTSGSTRTPQFPTFNVIVPPRPMKKPTEVRIPKVTVELVREVTLPRPKSTDPVDPVTVASIEPVKWVAKYTKPFTEEPPKPKETPVQPPLIPEPKKPEEKPLPTPPKKEELPKRPELKAIASGSNSFVVKSRKATRPNISVERIQYVAEGRVSSANSLVVRTKNEVKRAGSGNSFIIRRM